MTSIHSWFDVHPTRGAAFAIHLVLSLLVFSTLVAVMLVYWFPGDLFIMDGGWEGLKLVAMVDLVLGPALTLILFKPGKPGLKFDLSVIAGIQILALAYGFYTTYNQRTVAVVFAMNEFSTVSAADKLEADEQLANFDIEPSVLPRARAFAIPQFLTPAPENFGKYLEETLNGYPDAHLRSDQYVALEAQHDDMQPHAKSSEELETKGSLGLVEKALNKRNLTMDQIEVYPFRARYGSGYALFDPEKRRVVDFVRGRTQEPPDAVAENQEA